MSKWLRWFHLTSIFVWSGLLVPTVLWWKDSILWVAIMSVYAIVISHWGAYQGARAEREAGNDEDHKD
jgi:hypothetical protein